MTWDAIEAVWRRTYQDACAFQAGHGHLEVPEDYRTADGAWLGSWLAKQRIILASNTVPGESRWPALQKIGIDDLFCAALLSYPLGVRKPEPLFTGSCSPRPRRHPSKCSSSATTSKTM